jgi:uncharacterized membrane protein
MTKNNHRGGDDPAADAGTFDRSFRYAIIIYAVVEFVAIALLVYYKAAR